MKTKRTYTVSPKVLKARKALGRKRKGSGRNWTTVKVVRENVIWAKQTHGSVNAALDKERNEQNDGTRIQA